MRVIVPTAMSGIFSAIMIGMGRAVGETMIVVMAAGNTPLLDWNIFSTACRALSANIAVELPGSRARFHAFYRMLFLVCLDVVCHHVRGEHSGRNRAPALPQAHRAIVRRGRKNPKNERDHAKPLPTEIETVPMSQASTRRTDLRSRGEPALWALGGARWRSAS